MDPDGYPDDAELTAVREWPWQDFAGLMGYLRERWQYADMGYWHETDWRLAEFGGGEKKEYHLHTAGWSGNESLIDALQQNQLMWAFHWVSSRRGGHYVFEEPRQSALKEASHGPE
jgi:hypothetical protein